MDQNDMTTMPAHDDRVTMRAVTNRVGDPQGFLSKAECQAIYDKCAAFAKGGGEIRVHISSEWTSGVQWGRSRAHTSYDQHSSRVSISRVLRGVRGYSSTDRVDDAGLRELVQRAETSVRLNIATTEYDTRKNAWSAISDRVPLLTPTLWSDATYAFDGEKRGALVRQLIEPADAAGLLAAGELRVQAKSFAAFSSAGGPVRYYPLTRAVFSTTVRDPKGTGSGWAGTDDFDITRIDMPAFAQRALDKCQRSMNPVAIEPGRYTTILEAQAVADLLSQVSGADMDWLSREVAEKDHMGPFAKPNGTRLGEHIVDTRLTWSADPMDPAGGFLPFARNGGAAHIPTKWIDKGYLRDLFYGRGYGLAALGREDPLPSPGSWRLSGGTTPIDEMIATTKRGLMVTRFHNIVVRDSSSFTCTGFTRDGVWFIENGKITKPAKNFRFTESPFFVFNRIEQLGAPQRVFSEGRFTEGQDLAWIAPSMKVHDFNFTQLADAV
jgi:predicted Zn-dependent protease